MAVRRDDVKTILEEYFCEEMVDDIISGFCRVMTLRTVRSNERDEEIIGKIQEIIQDSEVSEDEMVSKIRDFIEEYAVDKIIQYVYDFFKENDREKYGDAAFQLFDPERDALFRQLDGVLPVERPKPYGKPETEKICITQKEAEIWLAQEPKEDSPWSHGKAFIALLKEALDRNIGAFEVPIGFPIFDEFGRLSFCKDNRWILSLDTNTMKTDFLDLYGTCYHEISGRMLNDFAKRNGDVVVLGDKWHFALYLVSIMNKCLEESGKSPEFVFDAFIGRDNDDANDWLGSPEFGSRYLILENNVIVSSITQDGNICYAKTAIRFFLEDGFGEDDNLNDEEMEPFFIIK